MPHIHARSALHIVLPLADASRSVHYGPRMKVSERLVSAAVWLTPQQASEYLGVGIDLIYDAIAAGGLKHTRLGHRTIRLKRDWVDAWAEEHARQAK